MLILTSNGLSSPVLLEEAKKYVIGLKTAAIVTTASVGYKEKDWHIPRITEELTSLGLSVAYVDIEFAPPTSLFAYDVVLINGGNPFYLLDQMRKQNATPVFEKLAVEKVLIGVSAGSLVMQEQLALAYEYTPEQNDDFVQLKDFSALALIPFEVLPHYDAFLSRVDGFEERAAAYEKRELQKVIRLNDGAAIFLPNNAPYYIIS